MERTIKGKSLDTIYKELAAPCTYPNALKFDNSRYPYYVIQAFRKRMDEVLGVEHYNVSYTPLQMLTFDNRSEGVSQIITTVCTITLLDDNFQPFVSKSCGGGEQPQPIRETGRFNQLNNSAESAFSHAFKTCCKLFDIFGMGTDIKEDDDKKNNSSTKNSSQRDENVIYSTFTSKTPIIVKEGTNSAKPSFTTNILMEDESTRELIFWNRQMSEHKEKFESLVALSESHCSKGKSYKFACYVTEKDYKGTKQYHFQGFKNS